LNLDRQLRTLLADIKEGRKPALVLIAAAPGRRRSQPTDAYLARECVRLLVDRLLPEPDDRDTGYIRLSASDRDFAIERVTDEMREGAFFGGAKVVLVERFPGGGAGSQELRKLGSRESWAPENTLILSAAESPTEKARKPLDEAEDATVLDATAPRPGEVASVVAKMARRRGVTIADDAVHLLTDLVGTALSPLWMEVCKLSDYVAERGAITRSDVAAVCAETREHDVFALVDAIAVRNTPRALRELERLLDEQTDPYRIAALLATQFRRVLALRASLDGGMSLNEAASAASVPPWLARRLDRAVRQTNVPSCKRALGTLRTLDDELKRLRTPARMVFENHVLSLLGR
jgi:DNA polymerase III subunit delta